MQGPRRASLRSARELLGVRSDADATQLARAYRRQARRLHPDISSEPDATEQFWALQAAYRLALESAPRHATPSSPPPVVPSAAAPATPPATEHRDPVVVLGATMLDGVPDARRTGPGAWLVAGPVHVQPPRPPDVVPTDTSPEGLP